MLSMPLLVQNYPMFVSLPIRRGRYVVPENDLSISFIIYISSCMHYQPFCLFTYGGIVLMMTDWLDLNKKIITLKGYNHLPLQCQDTTYEQNSLSVYLQVSKALLLYCILFSTFISVMIIVDILKAYCLDIFQQLSKHIESFIC